MAKLSQVLSIDPSTQITFRGDFREEVSVDLSLKNTTNRRLCFKVKTNYPHRYFVRPNGGVIEPSEQQIVTIMLRPTEIIEEEFKLHKFLVQAIYAPDTQTNGLETLWKETKPDNIMATKILCAFEQIQAVKDEMPRYRGSNELEINGTTTQVRRPEVDQKSTKDRRKESESSSNAFLFVVLLLLGLLSLILFGYLSIK